VTKKVKVYKGARFVAAVGAVVWSGAKIALAMGGTRNQGSDFRDLSASFVHCSPHCFSPMLWSNRTRYLQCSNCARSPVEQTGAAAESKAYEAVSFYWETRGSSE